MKHFLWLNIRLAWTLWMNGILEEFSTGQHEMKCSEQNDAKRNKHRQDLACPSPCILFLHCFYIRCCYATPSCYGSVNNVQTTKNPAGRWVAMLLKWPRKKKIESLWLKCRNRSSVPHLEGFKCSFDVNLLCRWCVTVHIQYVTWGRWEIGFIFYFACLNIAWWKVCCCCFQFILAWLVLNILRFLWI